MRPLCDDDLFRFEPQVLRWSLFMKLRNPFAGLSFFTKCSDGSTLVIARHWPHLLCWDWSLSFGGKVNRYFYRTNAGGSAGLWRFRFTWQNYGYMVALNYRKRAIEHISRQFFRMQSP